mmetsp:Transcript_10739/g.16093  ORF Transcript_10739/g.16093 Transcript_10739/m.16093 type:complete len:93 (+) Transcript_10739:208-486(+)
MISKSTINHWLFLFHIFLQFHNLLFVVILMIHHLLQMNKGCSYLLFLASCIILFIEFFSQSFSLSDKFSSSLHHSKQYDRYLLSSDVLYSIE